MNAYLFAEPGALRQLGSREEEVQEVLGLVVRGTPVEALVTCVYLLRRSRSWRGVYYRMWQNPDSFRARRGHWGISTRFGTPVNLPRRYRLIRVLIGARLTYPMQARDRSGFQHSYESFRDHLADLFAHELHHYRRYHLGLHPREGEAGANRWALKRVRSLNFAVEGGQLLRQKQRSFNRTSQVRERHHERLRLAPTGSRLRVTYRFDNRLKRGETVTLVRPLRKPSPRIAVRTAQGKEWWAPMDWLELVTETTKGQTPNT